MITIYYWDRVNLMNACFISRLLEVGVEARPAAPASIRHRDAGEEIAASRVAGRRPRLALAAAPL